jgi:hypothetical protein
VQIDVQPTGIAAAGAAAAGFAGLLRQAVGRLHAASPPDGGTRALAAWLSMWPTLATGLLDLAAAADEFAALSRAAATQLLETEGGAIRSDGP